MLVGVQQYDDATAYLQCGRDDADGGLSDGNVGIRDACLPKKGFEKIVPTLPFSKVSVCVSTHHVCKSHSKNEY